MPFVVGVIALRQSEMPELAADAGADDAVMAGEMPGRATYCASAQTIDINQFDVS